MSNVLAAALGRSGRKAGKVTSQTDDDETMVNEEEDAETTVTEDADETDAETTDPDEEAEGDDNDYTAADEETDEEMAASRRGANRVLAIMGSEAGMANPAGALKVARMEKLSASEAIDLIPNATATKPKGKLDSRLRGKAKAVAPDAPEAAKPSEDQSLNDRMAARNAAAKANTKV
ncbi:MAG: hypothetical protein AAGG69_00680 [Pseudomonadota bacterium]